MKIILELAKWLFENDFISGEERTSVWADVLGIRDCLEDQREWREEETPQFLLEDEKYKGIEHWWNLRGAGVRPSVQRVGHGKAPSAAEMDAERLNAQLPILLAGEFDLGKLILDVARASGLRPENDWQGIMAAAKHLYKLDAEKLHDTLRKAVMRNPKQIGKFLWEMEDGMSLLPKNLLSGLGGEVVTAIRRRINGSDESYVFGRDNRLLKFPNINALNEALIVRNRFRRIYRLWVAKAAEFDRFGRANGGQYGIMLSFGKCCVEVPFRVWWKLQDPKSPKLGGLKGFTVEKSVYKEDRYWSKEDVIRATLADCVNKGYEGYLLDVENELILLWPPQRAEQNEEKLSA